MEIFRFLHTHQIAYQRYDHPPVFTCEEANALCPKMPAEAIKTKNLFLRDKPGRRHFLVTIGDDKCVDIKALAPLVGVSNLSFASADRLERYLRLTPGSVTLLGVVNDAEHAVSVVIDEAVWNAAAVCCHPLINTSTVVLPQRDLRRIFEITGHQAQVLNVPQQVIRHVEGA